MIVSKTTLKLVVNPISWHSDVLYFRESPKKADKAKNALGKYLGLHIPLTENYEEKLM